MAEMSWPGQLSWQVPPSAQVATNAPPGGKGLQWSRGTRRWLERARAQQPGACRLPGGGNGGRSRLYTLRSTLTAGAGWGAARAGAAAAPAAAACT